MSTQIHKVPSLKLAEARLKKLDSLANFLLRIKWKHKILDGLKEREFVGRECTRQRTLVRAIEAKRAILGDSYE